MLDTSILGYSPSNYNGYIQLETKNAVFHFAHDALINTYKFYCRQRELLLVDNDAIWCKIIVTLYVARCNEDCNNYFNQQYNVTFLGQNLVVLTFNRGCTSAHLAVIYLTQVIKIITCRSSAPGNFWILSHRFKAIYIK